MNALICAIDKDGTRLTAIASCTWEFRQRGLRMVSEDKWLDVRVSGIPAALEVLTMDGEHVFTVGRECIGQAGQLVKGDVLVIRAGSIDIEMEG